MVEFSNLNGNTDSISFTKTEYEVYKPTAAELAITKKIADDAKMASEAAVKANAIAKAKEAAVLTAKINAEAAKRVADNASADILAKTNALVAANKLKEAELAEKLAQQQASAAIIADTLAAKKAKEEAEKLALIKKEYDAAKKAKEEAEAKRKSAAAVIITQAQRDRNARINRLRDGGIQVINGYGYTDDSPDRRLWNSSEKILLIQSEAIRRSTEDERRVAIDALITNEPQTKLEFDKYAAMLQTEFDLLMQTDYPWFVGERNITPSERIQKEKEVESEKERLKLVWETRWDLNLKNKKAELLRKEKESQLAIGKLRDDEQQEIFEDVVSDDEIEMQDTVVNGMTEIEKARKSISDIEDRLGRRIVPHRDMIESTDSDFDVESQLNPDDILIRDGMEDAIGQTEERQYELQQLKNLLEAGVDDEALYITEKIAASVLKAAMDSATDTFKPPNI